MGEQTFDYTVDAWEDAGTVFDTLGKRRVGSSGRVGPRLPRTPASWQLGRFLGACVDRVWLLRYKGKCGANQACCWGWLHHGGAGVESVGCKQGGVAARGARRCRASNQRQPAHDLDQDQSTLFKQAPAAHPRGVPVAQHQMHAASAGHALLSLAVAAVAAGLGAAAVGQPHLGQLLAQAAGLLADASQHAEHVLLQGWRDITAHERPALRTASRWRACTHHRLRQAVSRSLAAAAMQRHRRCAAGSQRPAEGRDHAPRMR